MPRRLYEQARSVIDSAEAELVDLAVQLVRIPSVNVDRARATGADVVGVGIVQHLAHRWMTDRSFPSPDIWQTSPGEWNVASGVGQPGSLAGARGPYNLTLVGHVDVVPAVDDNAEEWRHGSPWSASVEGGRLFGRGAADMKGGVAAMMFAAHVVNSLGIENASGRCSLALVSGEESGNAEAGVLSAVARGYIGPHAVLGEPTAGALCPQSMGFLFVKLIVRGCTAHPCVSDQLGAINGAGAVVGVNAIEKALKLSDAISAEVRDWSRRRSFVADPKWTNAGLVAIRAGVQQAQVPDACEVVMHVQYDPALSPQWVEEHLGGTVSRHCMEDPWLRRNPPIVEMPAIHANLRPGVVPVEARGRFVRAVATTMGKSPKVGTFPGPCDASFLAARGTHTWIMGPGNMSDRAHSIDESVPVADIVQACKGYAALMITAMVAGKEMFGEEMCGSEN